MGLTAKAKYLLNNFMGPVAHSVGLGDLVDSAYSDGGLAPSHTVLYGGTFTTVGGDVNEAISVSGVLGTDLVAVSVKTKGAAPVSIVQATAAANAINVELSADPSNDHVLQYVVYRATS